MKRILSALFSLVLSLTLLIGGLLNFIPQVSAVVSQTIHYQGRLYDSSGNLLGGSGTNYFFKFSIWKHVTSTVEADRVWPASAPTEKAIQVKSGVFNCDLGSSDATLGCNNVAEGDLSAVDFQSLGGTLYLEIEVSSTSGSGFQTLSPRQRIVSQANALNADKLQGATPGTGANNVLKLNSSGGVELSGTNPLISATAAGSSISILANGTGNVVLGTGTNSQVQFFGSTYTLTNAGVLTIAQLTGTGALTIASGGATSDLTLNAAGTGKVKLAFGSTGNVEFFTTSTSISSGGDLTIAGKATVSGTGTSTVAGPTSFGSAALVSSTDLLLGTVDTTSTGNFLRFVNEATEQYRIEVDGDVVQDGNLTFSQATPVISATAVTTDIQITPTRRTVFGGQSIVLGSVAGDPGTTANGQVFYDSAIGKVKIVEAGVIKVVCNTTDLACGTGSGAALSAITAATAGNSINSGDNAQVWNWQITTASKSAFTFGENLASTGSGAIILNLKTLSGSTALPFQVTAQGTANGVQVTTAGTLQAIGTGSILATDLSCTNCIGATEIDESTIASTGLSDTVNIAYLNQSETVLNNWTFFIDDAETLQIAWGVSGIQSGQGESILVTNLSTSGNQYGLKIDNAASSSGTTEALVMLDNADADTVVTSAIEIANSSRFTNILTIGATTLTATELGLLDTKTTLVDIDDAVATAITGTGALNSGSITSGFGSIDVGTDTITTTGTITGGTLSSATHTGSAGVTLSSGGTSDLTFDSASNILVIAATDTTIRRTAVGVFTIDLSDAADTTLALTNSNVGAGIDAILRIDSLTNGGAGCDTIDTDASGNLICGTDATGAGGGIATIEENDVAVVTSATVIDFLGADFIVGAVGFEGNISIDYVNSAITRNNQSETIINDWTFSLAEAEDLAINLSISGTQAGQAQFITLTNSTTAGNQYGLRIDNAASTGTTDALVYLDNSDVDTVVTTAIEIANSSRFTNILTIGATTLTATELGLLDGKTTLVDIDDAVSTAITGTGALGSGSITSGFGSIDIGTDSLTAGAAVLTGGITANDSDADTFLIGQSGATDDIVTIAGDISLTDDQWSITAAGVGNLVTGTVIGSQTFTTNNIADSGVLTVSSGGSGALTLRSSNQSAGSTNSQNVNINSGNAAGATSTAGNIILDVGTSTTSNGSILIGTAARTQTITIGNSTGGATRLGQNGGTVQIDGTNFDLATDGSITLVGGQVRDITTANATTATAIVIQAGTSSGASSNGPGASLRGGNASGTTSVTGGQVNVIAGSANGASGTRFGGSVFIEGGDGASGDGSVFIGNSNTSGITLGNTTNNTTLTLSGTGLTLLGGGLTVTGTSSIAGLTTLGSATLASSTNLLEGTVDTTATGNFLRFVNEATEKFRIEVDGDTVSAGSFTGTTGTFTSASSLTLGTSSSATGGIIFKNATNVNTFTQESGVTSASYKIIWPTAIGAANDFLKIASIVGSDATLTWAAGGGAGCATCLQQVPTVDSDNTVVPTADVLGLLVKQTSNASPTKNVFGITDSGGTNFAIKVDSARLVSVTSAGLLTLASTGANNIALTPGTGSVNITAGNLQTGGTDRLTNAGALSNITGYNQTSGTASITSAATSGNVFSLSDTALNTTGANLANLTFTNANTGVGPVTITGVSIAPTGSTNANANANILNAINLPNVTTIANNAFYAVNVGTGYNDILRYNGTQLISGTGIVQSAAISGSYTGVTGVGTLTAGSLGAGFTTVAVARGGTGVTTFGGANTILYTTAADTLSSIATASDGVLITSAGGVPSISSTLPSAVQGNITSLGTLGSLTVTGTIATSGNNLGAFNVTENLSATGTVNGLTVAPTLGGTAAANTYTLNAVNVANVAGTCPVGATCVNNGINFGTGLTNYLTGSGFTVTSSGNITAGTYNSNTLTSTALTFAGANPNISASTANTALTINANGTGTVTLASASTGNVQFFSSSNAITSGGALSIAGSLTPGTTTSTSTLNSPFNNTVTNGDIAFIMNHTGTAFADGQDSLLVIQEGGVNKWAVNKDGGVAQSGSLAFDGATGASIVTSQTNQPLSISANGTGSITLGSSSTGDIQFYSASNKITSTGALTIAAGATLGAAPTLTNASGTLTISSAGALAISSGGTNTDVIVNAIGTGNIIVGGTVLGGVVRIGDGTNNITFAATSRQARFAGTARNTVRINLVPEFPGAVMTGDGTTNVGTMTSDATTASPFHNYYKWTSTGTNDYDIWVKVPTPTDLDGVPSGQTICAQVFSSTTAANSIQVAVRDTGDTLLTLTDADLTPSVASTWQEQCTSSISAGTFAANDWITLTFKLTSPASGDIRLGEVYLDYLSKF